MAFILKQQHKALIHTLLRRNNQMVNTPSKHKYVPVFQGSWKYDQTQKDSLVEIAYRELIRRFVMLELAPGSIWKEKDLADSLELGRTPIREAVLRMASDQLVTVLKRAGVVIASTSIEDQLCILEARHALETVVSVRAARYALNDERRYLEEEADRLEEAGLANDLSAYLQTHFRIKNAVATFSRNPYAARALVPLHIFSQRFYFKYFHELNNLMQAVGLHARLTRAVVNGDAAAVEKFSNDVNEHTSSFTRDLLLKAN